ncbi:MAG TPA: hypothetical protein VIU63_02445 [Nitrospira sp.]
MRNKDQRGEVIQHLLKRELLRYLKEQGGVHYSLIYVRFERNRKTDIEAILQELMQSNLIKVDQDKLTRITDAGLQLLEATQD